MYYTVYGSICTFTWHFSTHLCTVYSIWFNMYIHLALFYTSMYSVLFMVQYVHLPDNSLQFYVECTVHGSICTLTWHFSTHLCTVYSIWFNLYIYLALLYTSMYILYGGSSVCTTISCA